jgi:hypothetical protein
MHQRPELSRVAPYYQRAAIASCNLDRSRTGEPDVMQSGLADCLDAVDEIPRGGYALSTVVGSYAHCRRSPQ